MLSAGQSRDVTAPKFSRRKAVSYCWTIDLHIGQLPQVPRTPLFVSSIGFVIASGPRQKPFSSFFEPVLCDFCRVENTLTSRYSCDLSFSESKNTRSFFLTRHSSPL
jgi:hypothetical protein